MFKYLVFGVSITVISWVVGMIMNAGLRKTDYYRENLSNLNFIRSENLNKGIGLGAFKWIVKNTFFKFFNQKLKARKKIEITDLLSLRNEMTKSEIDHLLGFGFVSVFAAAKFINHHYAFGITIMMVNMLMNLYPSLLQQENKRRIDILMRKFR